MIPFATSLEFDVNYDIFAVCGGIIAMLFIVFPLKEFKNSFFVITLIAISLTVILISMKGIIPIIQFLGELSGDEVGGYVKIIIKIFGITFMCNLTSELAQDMGMATLSGKVELAGKVAIIISILPIFDNLLSEVKTLL